eukprot:GCRY01001916.1.p1 GENE.GCRY01001916.1~~GCRY01001916.1.p1  ORF type:complete len:245 (-),score=30.11 GCRY01001916.1:837-1472(-)
METVTAEDYAWEEKVFKNFDREKEERLKLLYLPDKSPKGNVDVQVIPLLDLINSLHDYYSMSSCSGRISLSTTPENGTKGLEWRFVSHDTITFSQLGPALQDIPSKPLWFRQEGLILHICARNTAAALQLLHLAQNNGFKHAGIIAAKKRIVVEIIGQERMDIPISDAGQLLVSENYLERLVNLANEKLSAVHAGIARLHSAFTAFKKDNK